jgi:carboxypeptidase family protein
MLRMLVTITTIVVTSALLPATASAQSAIAGQVKDNTGAVLPGVTVEAASPALIEGRRSVVTDGEGRFAIVNLRPGTYTVTYMLEGFTRVERQGIALPSNFTATVDATLSVGSLTETLTVTGKSPIVDVQQAQRSQVLDHTMLDSIVNSRRLDFQLNLAAGVRSHGVDVGGTDGVDSQASAHGAGSLHNTYMFEGLSVDNAIGHSDGSDNINYYTVVGNQEMVVETSGGTAEQAVGGVRLNIIPKDGGNTFSGTAYAGWSSGAWQSDNFTQRLQDVGVSTLPKIDRIWDFSGTVGGPVLRDRLWFHYSMRDWGRAVPVLNSFYDDGRPFISSGARLGLVPRLTWQATPRNKVTAYLEWLASRSGPKLECCVTAEPVFVPGQRGTDPETGTRWWGPWDSFTKRPYGVGYVKWSSPLSSRLLLEAGYSTSFVYPGVAKPQPGLSDPARGTPEWYSRAVSVDLDRGTRWFSTRGSITHSLNHEASFAASYVTGTHNVKVGIQRKDAGHIADNESLGDTTEVRYRSGVPDSVLVGNYPATIETRLNYDLGVYAQDRWALGRLSLTYGLRSEWVNAGVPAQSAPAGRFTEPRNIPEVKDAPNWGPDVSPRFGLAYDLFGNAKTAVKFSAGKYFTRVMTSLASISNPLALTSASLPWSDRDLQGRALPTNNDRVVQDNELDLTRLPTDFGTKKLVNIDPDFKREYNIETALSVQHELLRGVSVSAGWYRRSFHNIAIGGVRNINFSTLGYNVNWSFDDYVPVQVVSPYNGEVFTAYNLKSAALLPQVDTLLTTSKTNHQVYHGFEFAFQGRLPGGGVVLTSSTTQRTLANTCDQPDDPNRQRFCDRFNLPAPYTVTFRTDFKLAGSYPLPFGLEASADFTSYPGMGGTGNAVNGVEPDKVLPINWDITRTTRYTEADCVGRPCTPGALVIPGLVQTSLVLPLVPAGVVRQAERQNQLNFGLRKLFRMGGYEWAVELNLFNALNADTIVSEVSDRFGTAAYAVPALVLPGRLPRLAVRLNW